MSGKLCLVCLQFGQVLEFFCISPGRLCSRLSHSTSLDGEHGPQPDRSDTSACLVEFPQTCSHSRQLWEYTKPSAEDEEVLCLYFIYSCKAGRFSVMALDTFIDIPVNLPLLCGHQNSAANNFGSTQA